MNILPLAIGLESARNLLVRTKMTHILVQAPRWNCIMWLYGISPALLLTLIFGSLTQGTAAHFRSAHGILGLITVIIGFLASGLHIIITKQSSTKDIPQAGLDTPSEQLVTLPRIRVALNQIFLAISGLSSILGFSALSNITLCIAQTVAFALAVSLGFGLATIFILGMAISSLDVYVRIRDFRNISSNKRGRGMRGKVEIGRS
jgi:hypothetical protein